MLLVLLAVWTNARLERDVTQDWSGTTEVALIPVIADDQADTRRFVANLEPADFNVINRYLIGQAKNYGRDLEYALNFRLAPVSTSPPPAQPTSNSAFAVAWWSLKFRWWHWRNRAPGFENAQISIYLLYQSPQREIALPHSLGLQKGLLGMVHARAHDSQASLHNVVITHELLHILGASDKYDLGSGQPIFPAGYANTSKRPLHPQSRAEIMARSIALGPASHRVAVYLRETMIGAETAAEVGWQ